MFRAEGSADFVHPFRGYAHGIAAALAVAFRLEQAGALFLRPIGWPVVAASINIQLGMGQGAESLRPARQGEAVKAGLAGRGASCLPGRS